jgi:hypothetical protein
VNADVTAGGLILAAVFVSAILAPPFTRARDPGPLTYAELRRSGGMRVGEVAFWFLAIAASLPVIGVPRHVFAVVGAMALVFLCVLMPLQYATGWLYWFGPRWAAHEVRRRRRGRST